MSVCLCLLFVAGWVSRSVELRWIKSVLVFMSLFFNVFVVFGVCGCGVLGFACCWVGVFWELDARVVSFRCCLLGSRFMALGVLDFSFFA